MRISLFLAIIAIGGWSVVAAQDKKKADSIRAVLTAVPDTLTLGERITLLDRLAQLSTSLEDVLYYSNLLLKAASADTLVAYRVDAYQYMGVAYRMKGNLKLALKCLFESAGIAAGSDLPDLEAEAYVEIATTYTSNNDLKNALIFENKALARIRKHGTPRQLAINLLNTGYGYYALNLLDSALLFYNEAEPLFETLPIGKAYLTGNRALVYWKKGRLAEAERDLIKAIGMLAPLGDEFGMADYHNQLGRLYFEQGKDPLAIEHTQAALTLAEGQDMKEQIRDASLLLSKLYTRKRDFERALKFGQQYIASKDSLENKEKIREMADLRTEFEVSLKEKEIDLLEQQQTLNKTYIAIAVSLLASAVVLLLYFRQRLHNSRLVAEREHRIQQEKIEALLKNQESRALQSLVIGREEERKRIAQELHNHLGSLLATVKINLHALSDLGIPNYPTIASLVDQACNDVRNMSHALNMGISEDFGLLPALRDLTTHLRQSGDLDVEFNASIQECRLDTESEIMLYRIVQELISNVLKHAQATRLSLQLTYLEGENLINIMVQDNGIGFTPTQKSRTNGGIGLGTIRQMIQQRHGEIHFDSNPASGTTVNIDLPIINTYA